MKKFSKIDAAYLAGLVDGEGSIGIYFNGQSFVGRLTIGLTTPSVLKWVLGVTGVGNLRVYQSKVSQHNPEWWYVVLSKQAYGVISQIHPYLKIKNKQAENLMVFQSLSRKVGVRLNKTQKKERANHARISKILNKRGR